MTELAFVWHMAMQLLPLTGTENWFTGWQVCGHGDATLTPHGDRKLLGLCAGSVGFVLMQLLPLTGTENPCTPAASKSQTRCNSYPSRGQKTG